MRTEEFLERSLNVVLRGLSMVSRFALLFFLARFLEPSDIGLFGLMLATVLFSVLIIGGDFYIYSQRELMAFPRGKWSFVIQHQAIAILLIYLFLVPLQLFIFFFDLLPEKLIFWFFALLIVEHIAQEINRLLIAMQAQLMASWVLLVRNGMWVWVLLPVMWGDTSLRELETVFIAWLLGGLLAVVLGCFMIFRRVGDWRWWSLDWLWIRKGFRIGVLFLFATVCLKALFTVDRYVVEHLMGLEMLGVYVMYASIAMAIINILDPAVFSFLYPRLINAWRTGMYATYQKVMRELIVSAVVVCVVLALGLALISPWLFAWIGKAVYLEHQSLLWILLVSAVVYGIGMVPHYALYARGADRTIMVAHISSIFIFVLVTVITSSIWPLQSPAIGLVFSLAWVGCIKQLRLMVLGRAPKPDRRALR